MTLRIGRFLGILCFFDLFAFVYGATYTIRLTNEQARLTAQIDASAAEIARRSPAEDSASVRAMVSVERARFYRVAETSDIDFAGKVERSLLENRLRIEGVGPAQGRASTRVLNGSYRYQVRGSALDFVRFLKMASSGSKYWRCDPLRLWTEDSHLRAEVTIGYVVYESPNGSR